MASKESPTDRDELRLKLLKETGVSVETETTVSNGSCDIEEDSNHETNKDNSDGNGFLGTVSNKVGEVSNKVDLFFSADGETLPRVSMFTNIAYMIPSSVVVAVALFVVNKLFEDKSISYRIKLFARLSTVATIYVLSSVYVLGVKKIPSGMAIAVGGVHAFLMNSDIGYEFWPAWITASLWALGAAIFLCINSKNNRNTGTTSLARDAAVWALYTNLAILSLPNLTRFGGEHDPALLARSALLVSGFALGHPTFQLFGWVAIANMVFAFFFPRSFFQHMSDSYYTGIANSFFQA